MRYVAAPPALGKYEIMQGFLLLLARTQPRFLFSHRLHLPPLLQVLKALCCGSSRYSDRSGSGRHRSGDGKRSGQGRDDGREDSPRRAQQGTPERVGSRGRVDSSQRWERGTPERDTDDRRRFASPGNRGIISSSNEFSQYRQQQQQDRSHTHREVDNRGDNTGGGRYGYSGGSSQRWRNQTDDRRRFTGPGDRGSRNSISGVSQYRQQEQQQDRSHVQRERDNRRDDNASEYDDGQYDDGQYDDGDERDSTSATTAGNRRHDGENGGSQCLRDTLQGEALYGVFPVLAALRVKRYGKY